jgi:hypothetical protein
MLRTASIVAELEGYGQAFMSALRATGHSVRGLPYKGARPFA